MNKATAFTKDERAACNYRLVGGEVSEQVPSP